MKYADGAVYEGDWLDDDFNGKGTIKLRNGAVYEGEW